MVVTFWQQLVWLMWGKSFCIYLSTLSINNWEWVGSTFQAFKHKCCVITWYALQLQCGLLLWFDTPLSVSNDVTVIVVICTEFGGCSQSTTIPIASVPAPPPVKAQSISALLDEVPCFYLLIVILTYIYLLFFPIVRAAHHCRRHPWCTHHPPISCEWLWLLHQSNCSRKGGGFSSYFLFTVIRFDWKKGWNGPVGEPDYHGDQLFIVCQWRKCKHSSQYSHSA